MSFSYIGSGTINFYGCGFYNKKFNIYYKWAEGSLLFGKKKAAIDDWQKYLKLNNNLEARYLYTTALFNAKQYCEAITEVNYLNANNLTNFYTERMLAFSYLECNPDSTTLKTGLEASNRFFAIVPANMVSYLDYKTRGALFIKLGKDSLGLLEYEKAIGNIGNNKRCLNKPAPFILCFIIMHHIVFIKAQPFFTRRYC